MSLKRYKILGIIIIFILCFPFHFLYELLPNPIFSFFFPVNESIWEHMKLLFTPFILYTSFEYLLIKKEENNFWLQLGITPIIAIFAYLIIYLPIYSIIGENMFFNIGLLLIIIALEQWISYQLSISKNCKWQKVLGIVTVFTTLATFIYLTYFPPKIPLFLDTQTNTYGIEK